jgi:hypothetical protein
MDSKDANTQNDNVKKMKQITVQLNLSCGVFLSSWGLSETEPILNVGH